MERHQHSRRAQHLIVEPLGTVPDLAIVHALDPVRYPALLESFGENPRLGRFDILCAFPGDCLELSASGSLRGPHSGGTGGFLSALENWWAEEGTPDSAVGELPFMGGWFVFLAYELAREIEPTVDLPADPSVPLAIAMRIPVAIVRDRVTHQTMAVAEPGHESRITDMRRDLATASRFPGGPAEHQIPVAEPPIHEEAPAAFIAAVRRAKTHIAAGDVYQINLSRFWIQERSAATQVWRIYQRLRKTNPAPFGGLARIGDTSILSSSPERLVRIRAGRVETRPIAGTRPRLDPLDPEHPRRTELITHSKERAEHVMLIDLERNDLGRICRRGTVTVDEFMSLESYAHVHHIVSNVSGELRSEATPSDALRAVFPGGTITGCPKVRCLELIREIEGRSRGAYTGSIGYLNRDGSLDFNILIRTMTVCGNRVAFAAGSGIVADSDPERELEETRAKAKGLLMALQGTDSEDRGYLAD